ncbi:predicted protein [Uncinocarpus reesii 1704]|uniref:RCC1-like domain-containing protein n=1 Tax=Uncinocarpus reesii (strain UAMH 1704) TaxID=336963 RepID=C4JEQ7_UNCRE|nr:uncharacterized protein UREG_02217 [Uncinocarpus reesii 1704]EEP77368.1 predicted protein [Uncinocarpus reesii 1704]
MPLYAFGSNGSGQLGLGHKEDVSRPTRCLFKPDSPLPNEVAQSSDQEDLVQLAAGGNHTLALFKSGAVYAAGSNGNGRCGYPAEAVEELLEFGRVAFYDGGRRVDQFAAVAATWESSCFVEAGTGYVYVVGVGLNGELGLGENVTEARSPTRMPNFPPGGREIICIAGALAHTVVVLSSGEVFGWGKGRKGQLGEAGRNKMLWSPQKIEAPFTAVKVACGKEFTILVGNVEDGELAVLGTDRWGQRSKAPANLKGYKTVGASWHGIYSHGSNGSLTAWGRSDRGQMPPADFPRITSMGIGSEHVVAAVDCKRIIAFGWGEHGNCGPETDEQGNVNGKYVEIPFEGGVTPIITAVGAGCATSFVIAR